MLHYLQEQTTDLVQSLNVQLLLLFAAHPFAISQKCSSTCSAIQSRPTISPVATALQSLPQNQSVFLMIRFLTQVNKLTFGAFGFGIGLRMTIQGQFPLGSAGTRLLAVVSSSDFLVEQPVLKLPRLSTLPCDNDQICETSCSVSVCYSQSHWKSCLYIFTCNFCVLKSLRKCFQTNIWEK